MEHPLAQYADSMMIKYWTPEYNVYLERVWWLRILRWMSEHTAVYDSILDFSGKIEAYTEVVGDINLITIAAREGNTKHDVKARIEEFNYLAENQYSWWTEKLDSIELIHWGLTSADVVDNVSLIKIRRSLEHLAMHGDHPAIELAIKELPLRGLKGPVGTQQDLSDLIGDAGKLKLLEEHLASTFGFTHLLNSVGQVYHRSIDFAVISRLCMAVREMYESPQPWLTILNGYLKMAGSYSGNQWNEGDVSTSVIRRVALPGAFLAADAALRGVKP